MKPWPLNPAATQSPSSISSTIGCPSLDRHAQVVEGHRLLGHDSNPNGPM